MEFVLTLAAPVRAVAWACCIITGIPAGEGIISDLDLLSLIFAVYSTVVIVLAAAIVSGIFLVVLRYGGGRAGLEQILSPPRDIRLAAWLIGAGWLLMALSNVINYWLVVPGLFCFLAGAFAIRILKFSSAFTQTRRMIEVLAIVSVLASPFVIVCVFYLEGAKAPWFLFR